jgi:hypothetical protein
MCWGIYLIVTQVRIGDTAAAVARQVARDDRAATARAEAAAPPGAVVTVDRRPQLITVTVRVTARPLAKGLVSVPLTARAEVVPEPQEGR